MKTIKEIGFIFLLVFGLLVLFGSCQNKIDGEYYVTNEMKSMVPFHGGEKVSFRVGDTILIGLETGDRTSGIVEVPIGVNTSHYEIRESERVTMKNNYYAIRYVLWGIHFSTHNQTLSIRCEQDDEDIDVNFILPLNNEPEGYIDSLFVFDRWVNDVYFALNAHRIEGDPNMDTVYYSVQYGVLKWANPIGDDWELEEIEW